MLIFSMALSDPEKPGTALVSNTGEIPSNCYGDTLNFVNNIIIQTNAYAEAVTNANSLGKNLSTKYENSNNNKLAGKLKKCCQINFWWTKDQSIYCTVRWF